MSSAVTRWQDWASFALALWLATSPWLIGYSDQEIATANAAIAGLTLAMVAHFEVSFGELSGEWLNIGGGLWLLLAPFVLGFDGAPAAATNSLAVGAFITGLSASALELDRDLMRLVQSASQTIRR
jgi:SPW repeat